MDLYIRKYDPEGTYQDVQITFDGQSSCPNIFEDLSGNLVGFYVHAQNEIRIIKSSDDGESWSSSVALSNYSLVEVEYIPESNIMVAMVFDAGTWYKTYSIDGGATWSTPIQKATGAAESKGSLKRELDGTLTFVYVDSGGTIQVLSDLEIME